MFLFFLFNALLLKKVLQTNGCARRAPKNMLMKIKNKSERFNINSCSRFIFYFPSVLVQIHLQKKEFYTSFINYKLAYSTHTQTHFQSNTKVKITVLHCLQV